MNDFCELTVMCEPLVSVCIPLYNHEQYITECILSVIDQTYNNIELIIINDGSSDNSNEKVLKLLNSCKERFSRFQFLSRENKGLTATINEAISWSKGEYFCSLASDDIWYGDKVQIQVDYFVANPEVAAISAECNKLKQGVLKKSRLNPFRTTSFSFEDIIVGNYRIPALNIMFPRQSILKHNGFNENVKIEDWWLLLTLTEGGGQIIRLNVPLGVYRLHDNNTIGNVEFMDTERKKVLECFLNNDLYEEAMRIYKFKSRIVNGNVTIIEMLKFLLKCILKNRFRLLLYSVNSYFKSFK